jgi:hypothetical protein
MAVTSSKGPGPTPRVYPPELKERAIGMVLESSDRGDQRFGTVTRPGRRLLMGPITGHRRRIPITVHDQASGAGHESQRPSAG